MKQAITLQMTLSTDDQASSAEKSGFTWTRAVLNKRENRKLGVVTIHKQE